MKTVHPLLVDSPPDSSIRKRQEEGFTLIEMAITLTIIGILIGASIISWGRMRQNTLVESVAEEAMSAMTAARTMALASRQPQYVAIDFANERIASTAWGGTYDAVNKTMAASTRWRSYGAASEVGNVDLVSSDSTGALKTTATSAIYTFTPRGTAEATTLPSGSSQTSSFVVRSKDANITTKRLLVTSSLGRVKLTKL